MHEVEEYRNRVKPITAEVVAECDDPDAVARQEPAETYPRNESC